MQCTIRQRRHLEYNSLRHAEPMKTGERVGDVVTTSQVENNFAAAFWTDWRYRSTASGAQQQWRKNANSVTFTAVVEG